MAMEQQRRAVVVDPVGSKDVPPVLNARSNRLADQGE